MKQSTVNFTVDSPCRTQKEWRCSSTIPVTSARWCSWFRHCATSRKVTGSIPVALGLTQLLTEMSTTNISRGGRGRCVGLTTLPLLCADLLEILEASTSWNPQELSRPVQGLLYSPLQGLLCLTCPLSRIFIQIFNFCQTFWGSKTSLVYRLLLGVFWKLRKGIISFVMSVRLSFVSHGTTRLPMNGFSLKFMPEYFSKKSRENIRSIRIGQE